MTKRQSACTGGLLGWLFGHKFVKSTLNYEYSSDYCYRCGKQRGQ